MHFYVCVCNNLNGVSANASREIRNQSIIFLDYLTVFDFAQPHHYMSTGHFIIHVQWGREPHVYFGYLSAKKNYVARNRRVFLKKVIEAALLIEVSLKKEPPCLDPLALDNSTS